MLTDAAAAATLNDLEASCYGDVHGVSVNSNDGGPIDLTQATPPPVSPTTAASPTASPDAFSIGSSPGQDLRRHYDHSVSMDDDGVLRMTLDDDHLLANFDPETPVVEPRAQPSPTPTVNTVTFDPTPTKLLTFDSADSSPDSRRRQKIPLTPTPKRRPKVIDTDSDADSPLMSSQVTLTRREHFSAAATTSYVDPPTFTEDDPEVIHTEVITLGYHY